MYGLISTWELYLEKFESSNLNVMYENSDSDNRDKTFSWLTGLVSAEVTFFRLKLSIL